MISRLHLSVIVGIAAAIWALLLIADGVAVDVTWLRPFSGVIGAMVLVLLTFEQWAWRWKWLHPWFVGKPDIQGTWRGELVSLWRDPTTGAGRPPIEVYLVVKQTFSSIRVRLISGESHSDCLVVSICEDAGGTQSLVGTYLNTPKILRRDGSPIHHGGMVLRILSSDRTVLDGDYWTDRGTKGSMRFEKWNPRRLYDFDRAASSNFRRKS